MRRYGEMLLILLLMYSTRSSLGDDVTDTGGKEFPLSFESSSVTDQRFAIQDDGSLLYWACNRFRSRGLKCQIHLINPPAPEIVHPLNFGITVKEARLLKFKMNGTTFYYLLAEQNAQYEEYVSGFNHDLSSNKTVKLALPSDLNYMQYIGAFFDDNAVVVVVRDHPVCGNFTRCKLVFNSQGQMIGNPVIFPHDYLNVKGYPKATLDQGLFTIGLLNQDPEIRQAIYIEPNGNLTAVKRFRTKWNPVLFSHTGGLYGYCAQFELNKKFECTQFDWKFNSTDTIGFNVEDLGKEEYLSSRVVSFANLDDSSFLFIVLECGKDRGSECKTAQVVTKKPREYASNPTPVFKELKCHNQDVIDSVIVEVDDQLCFYLLCINYPKPYESGHLYTKCLEKSIF